MQLELLSEKVRKSCVRLENSLSRKERSGDKKSQEGQYGWLELCTKSLAIQIRPLSWKVGKVLQEFGLEQWRASEGVN